jgi:hypothetical protein
VVVLDFALRSTIGIALPILLPDPIY